MGGSSDFLFEPPVLVVLAAIPTLAAIERSEPSLSLDLRKTAKCSWTQLPKSANPRHL